MTQYKMHYVPKLLAMAALSSLCLTAPAHAQDDEIGSWTDDWIQWHSTNVQLLRGHSYELGEKRRTIMTLEHANSWKYGDFFVFIDQSWPDSGKPEYYAEPTLRLSMNKMTGYDFSYGLVKDVLIAGQLEKPKGQTEHYLAGGAVDLNIPGFTYFKTHLFWRDNPDLQGSTYQVTLAWNRPFKAMGLNFLAEGFADFAGSEGRTTSHQLAAPRLLLDVGDAIGQQPNHLWAGIEWQYWHNKFGVDGVTESAPQLQVKWVF